MHLQEFHCKNQFISAKTIVVEVGLMEAVSFI